MVREKTLEWKRHAIILHHQTEMSKQEILNLLRNTGVNRILGHCVIKRFLETGTTSDRKRSGRPRSKRTPGMFKNLAARIRRNTKRRPTKLAQQMNVSTSAIRRTLKTDLGLKALKGDTYHMITGNQKLARVKNRKSSFGGSRFGSLSR